MSVFYEYLSSKKRKKQAGVAAPSPLTSKIRYVMITLVQYYLHAQRNTSNHVGVKYTDDGLITLLNRAIFTHRGWMDGREN